MDLELMPGTIPVHQKPYPALHAHMEVFKKELDQLCELGVLQGVGGTEWVARLVDDLGCTTTVEPTPVHLLVGIDRTKKRLTTALSKDDRMVIDCQAVLFIYFLEVFGECPSSHFLRLCANN
jgi:hypothetical protein